MGSGSSTQRPPQRSSHGTGTAAAAGDASVTIVPLRKLAQPLPSLLPSVSFKGGVRYSKADTPASLKATTPIAKRPSPVIPARRIATESSSASESTFAKVRKLQPRKLKPQQERSRAQVLYASPLADNMSTAQMKVALETVSPGYRRSEERIELRRYSFGNIVSKDYESPGMPTASIRRGDIARGRPQPPRARNPGADLGHSPASSPPACRYQPRQPSRLSGLRT